MEQTLILLSSATVKAGLAAQIMQEIETRAPIPEFRRLGARSVRFTIDAFAVFAARRTGMLPKTIDETGALLGAWHAYVLAGDDVIRVAKRAVADGIAAGSIPSDGVYCSQNREDAEVCIEAWVPEMSPAHDPLVFYSVEIKRGNDLWSLAGTFAGENAFDLAAEAARNAFANEGCSGRKRGLFRCRVRRIGKKVTTVFLADHETAFLGGGTRL